MRDPAALIDPKSEAAIEDTCRFLERSMPWTAAADGLACDCPIDAVEESNLPDWAKTFAIVALWEKAKKRRRGKPKQSNRDMAIQLAAIRLVLQGYKPTRNEVSNRDSASSIIHRALLRLGEKKLSEKSINLIVAGLGAEFGDGLNPQFAELRRSLDVPE